MKKPKLQMYFSDTEVGNYYSVSSGTIRRWVREGNFPRGKKLSSGSRRWLRSDIEKFDQEVLVRNNAMLEE
ncbi:helix-turn-helix transcriptional regulator [Marinobacter sp.]|uniref:helix-turn-helix transcriptional regulator n=1 Tax=Marinobacter sp. TaxID=50741 RepID=UPI003A8CA96A